MADIAETLRSLRAETSQPCPICGLVGTCAAMPLSDPKGATFLETVLKRKPYSEELEDTLVHCVNNEAATRDRWQRRARLPIGTFDLSYHGNDYLGYYAIETITNSLPGSASIEIFDLWSGQLLPEASASEFLCMFGEGPNCSCCTEPLDKRFYKGLPSVYRTPKESSISNNAGQESVTAIVPANSRRDTLAVSMELARISNFSLISAENGGPSIREPRPTQEIIEAIRQATGNWPKACAGFLFVPSHVGDIRWLKSPIELEAYLREFAGCHGKTIEWDRGREHIAMPVLYSSLLELSDRFEAVELFPHWPACPGTYYLNPPLPASGSGAFNEFLDMFSPETGADRALIRAFYLTLVAGIKPGGRPIFAFESAAGDGRPGQGSGKSTIVQKAGELLGGYVSIDLATDSGKDLMPRLLSAAGRRARLVIFDNVKGSRVSSSLIESNVTAPVLSGRQLFLGEGSRPNFLTWAITSNQASLSKDLAQRTYPIRVKPPRYSPAWEDRITRLITDNRWSIIADMIAELQRPPVAVLQDGNWSRWAAWEQAVLSRVCDPASIAAPVASRRADLDDDDTTAAAVRDAVAKFINVEKIIDPETHRIRMPADAIAKAVEGISPHGKNAIATCRWLASINVPGVQRKRAKDGRYWVWVGTNTTDADAFEDWNLMPSLPA